MAVVRKGHRGRAQLTKVDQGTDDCGSGTGNRVTARYREAAAQAKGHGRQWLWQCRAWLRSSCAGVAKRRGSSGSGRGGSSWWRWWLVPATAVTMAQGANRGCGAGLWWGRKKEMKSFGPPLCLNRALKGSRRVTRLISLL